MTTRERAERAAQMLFDYERACHEGGHDRPAIHHRDVPWTDRRRAHPVARLAGDGRARGTNGGRGAG